MSGVVSEPVDSSALNFSILRLGGAASLMCVVSDSDF